MKTWLMVSFLSMISLLGADELYVFSHDAIPEHSAYGNCYKGIATKSMGAKEIEMWRSSISVGSKTPIHVHETEEVFIILKGHILAIIGDEEIHCHAPATLICPAHIPHQLINVGDVPTDQILALGIGSKISLTNGQEINLPWRQ